MMRQQSNLRYARGDGYSRRAALRGGDVAMTILVPDSGGFQEFQDSLSGQSLQDIVDSLDYESVRLALPRFETESAFSLSDTLKEMACRMLSTIRPPISQAWTARPAGPEATSAG